MPTYFISDLHLDETRPMLTRLFFDFIARIQQADTSALYILGDFFEVWIGDDEQTVLQHQVAEQLKRLRAYGVPIYIMHGNRDFLMGPEFLARAGAHFLKDPSLVTLYGQKVLLTHGDSLCTDDLAYQCFRRFVQNPVSRWLFLHLPLRTRKKIAGFLRRKSQQHSQKKPGVKLDVNAERVIQFCRKHKSQLLIHGHTHQAVTHQHAEITRIVLAAWDEQGHYLTLDEEGLTKHHLFS